MISRAIVSLCFESVDSFESNLSHLIELIGQTPDDAIIVAPEVCLSGFSYDRFSEAANFTPYAIEKIYTVLGNRALIFTAIAKELDGFYNNAYVLHKNEIIHTQPKVKLFTIGGEMEHFKSGTMDDIVIFELDGIKISIIICFEMRFKDIWQRLEGSDIIAVPARWGKPRLAHFVTLTNALAVINQCFVVASDASGDEFSGMSGIIDPFGVELRNSDSEVLVGNFESRQIKAMRRYLSVGI